MNQSVGPVADGCDPLFVISMVVAPRLRLLRAHFGNVAVPVRGRHTAIHQEVTARDEAAIRPHEQHAYGTDFGATI